MSGFAIFHDVIGARECEALALLGAGRAGTRHLAPRCASEQVIALRLHLDPSTADNGPLRVVPGSHEADVLTDAEVIDYAHSHPQAECVSPPGGVIAMRPLLIHASSKNRSGLPRRVLHIEYATSLDPAPGVRLRVV